MSGVFITKTICFDRFCSQFDMMMIIRVICLNKGNNKITELRTILQRESPNS